MTVSVEIPDRTYGEYVAWCEANAVDVVDFIYRSFYDAYMLAKYGDLNEKMGRKPSRPQPVGETPVKETPVDTTPPPRAEERRAEPPAVREPEAVATEPPQPSVGERAVRKPSTQGRVETVRKTLGRKQ